MTTSVIDIHELTNMASPKCGEATECFGKHWGPNKFKLIGASYLDYCATNDTEEFKGIMPVRYKHLLERAHYYFGLPVYREKSGILEFKTSFYDVLQELQDEHHRMVIIEKGPLRYSLNEEGFHCAPCIISNGWAGKLIARSEQI